MYAATGGPNVKCNRWAKREMGGTDFKWRDQAPLASPLVTALDYGQTYYN